MERSWIVLGALFGGLAVALGAFGSHALKATLDANGRLDTYQTAVQYQMFHALALVALGLLSAHIAAPQIAWAGWLLVLGIILFSGSLYLLSIFNIRWMGTITPLGGEAFLLAWAFIAWAAWGGTQI